MKTNSFVIYCSPSGSTKHVAEVIIKTLKDYNTDFFVSDLGKEHNRASVLGQIKTAGENICLYVGSPVYGGHAVPPVMALIEELPQVEAGFAVPFVTWGGVTSGVALWEMGEALFKKGYKIAGAAKVGAVHSMLWQSETPVCQGHPDSNDDQVMRTLAVKVHEGLKDGSIRPLQVQDLDYQPEGLGLEMKKTSIKSIKQAVPQRTVNEEKCSQCGICVEECPAMAIRMEPYPKFSEDCFSCFNCMRLCPEKAIESELSMIEGFIRQHQEKINEQPLTQAFFGAE
jgi:ferredoxin/flavodoxin